MPLIECVFRLGGRAALQPAREADLGFKGSGTHRTVLMQDIILVIVIVVVRTTDKVRTRDVE